MTGENIQSPSENIGSVRLLHSPLHSPNCRQFACSWGCARDSVTVYGLHTGQMRPLLESSNSSPSTTALTCVNLAEEKGQGQEKHRLEDTQLSSLLWWEQQGWCSHKLGTINKVYKFWTRNWSRFIPIVWYIHILFVMNMYELSMV